jgi:tetratricopeptide (TPR) repeat protein
MESRSRMAWRDWQGCVLAAPLFVLLALGTSCGSDEGPGPGLTAEEQNEAGWESYNKGNFSGAAMHFGVALEVDPGLVEARLGMAWADAQEGRCATALAGFEEVIKTGTYSRVTDAHAGRAAAALASGEDSLAAISGQIVLGRAPDYFFRRHPHYNYRDVRLIMAQAYFGLAQYEYAQTQVDLLYVNGLDTEDPGSWVVGGVEYPTYESALLMLIELLWSSEGGDDLPGSPGGS